MIRPYARVSPLIPTFLRNRFSYMCPFNYNNFSVWPERMIGLTLFIHDYDHSITKRIKDDGKYFGTWVDTHMTESIELWEKLLIDPYGVDYIFTNRPFVATKVRD